MSAGALIDFTRLPAPEAVSVLDYETQLAAGIAKLGELLPEWDAGALESDPAKKIIEVFAYLDLLLRGSINDAIRALLLAHASGADLDLLASNVSVLRLSAESDDRLRERTQQAFWSVAAAGPGAAYRWHAMSVSAAIEDVSVYSPIPGQVTVTVLAPAEAPDDATEQDLLHGMAAFSVAETIIAPADHELLRGVREILNAETVRPLTDTLTVVPPTIKEYTIEATLTLYPGPDAELVQTEAELDLADYLDSILHMGYDATRAGIIDALVVPGVQNCALTQPAADIVCAETELALAVAIDTSIGVDRGV